MEIGTRVGAIRDGSGDTINLFGFGTYDGRQELPAELALFPGQCNPKITLDDGRVIWGVQCWWGTEDYVNGIALGKTVNIV